MSFCRVTGTRGINGAYLDIVCVIRECVSTCMQKNANLVVAFRKGIDPKFPPKRYSTNIPVSSRHYRVVYQQNKKSNYFITPIAARSSIQHGHAYRQQAHTTRKLITRMPLRPATHSHTDAQYPVCLLGLDGRFPDQQCLSVNVRLLAGSHSKIDARRCVPVAARSLFRPEIEATPKRLQLIFDH